MQELFLDIETKMEGALDHFHSDLKTLRVGRASISILEGVTVDYYGSPAPINQLANLSISDATMIVAQPFDPSQIQAIERAIQLANLGLNPSNDGRVIRIPIPALTEERRKEIVKRAHEMAEANRNGIRQARREGNDRLKALEKAKEISQDDEHRGHAEMQKLHDKYIGDTNKALQVKEEQIMEV